MDTQDNIKQKIEQAIYQYKLGNDLSHKTTAELLESINIYHQELEYQNEELHRTIMKLEESEGKYQDLFENAPVAYVIFDYGMKIREANTQFCELFRLSRAEARKKSISDFVLPDDQDDLYFYLRNTTQHNLKEPLKIRVHNGLNQLVVVMKASVEQSGGERFIRCAVIDKTEEHNYFQELWNREERFEQVTSLSRDMIWETDSEGLITYANRVFLEDTGYTAGELTGKINIAGLLVEEGKDEIFNIIRLRYNEIGGKRSIQHRLGCRSGKIIWVQTEYLPMISSAGQLTGFRGISRDITEMKIKIHDLMLSEEAANEMTKMKNHFLSSMSHEIRNPLVAIIGTSEMLIEMLEGDGEKTALVERIFKSSIRLRDTVSMILNLNRFEEVYTSNKSQIVDLKELLQEITEIFTPFALRKGIRLSFRSEDTPFIIQTSEIVILSVINNLVNNAIKYTEKGEVEVALRNEDGAIVVDVSDTGVGIADSEQRSIWDEFRQENESYSLNQEGSGFGLSLVKKYVELMGATITLTSSKGKGSRFTLKIPR